MSAEMVRMMGPALALAASYLLGSVPTGYLLVKWVKRVDVRTIGSGNIGATNTARAAGKGLAAVVFIIDVVKGLVPALVFARAGWPGGGIVAQVACGACAVVGHIFPVFLGFNGGKGVATAIGFMAGTSPMGLALFLCVWVAGMGLFGYVSVGSILAAATIPLSQVIWHQPLAGVLIGAAVAVLIIYRHRLNVQRLIQGKEHRLSFGGGSRRNDA